MCGPSGAQKSLAGEQASFFNDLMASYQQNFGQQQAIFSSINKALEPILEAGPNQQGFSAAENAALTGAAINSNATQARNAEVVAGSSVGGNTGVTTGGTKQLEAQIASTAGTALSSEENKINLANAQLGRQNFFSAEAGLGGLAGLENPNPGAVTSAGNSAFGSATTVQNMRNQEEADIAGGVAGLALAPFTGGMSLGGLKGIFGGGAPVGSGPEGDWGQ